MPVVKKRNQQTETRLLLESDDPVELPPAEVEERGIVLQFETFRQYLPELLEELRRGTVAEPVPVMMDGATFVVHGATRSFWVKLWHSSPERTRIERAHVTSCLPSTRGVQLIVDDPEEYLDDEDDDEDDDYDDDDTDGELDAGDDDYYPEEDDDEDEDDLADGRGGVEGQGPRES